MTAVADLIYWQARNLMDYTRHIVDGDLTSGGVQYSAVVDTTTANTNVNVISITLDSPIPEGCVFTALEWEFNLTAEFRAVSTATADLIWKWQARNSGGTWVDLHAAVTETNIGAAYVSRTYSGYATVVANLNEWPLDLKLLLQCNELNEGRARVKNSSFVRAIMRVKTT